jgi:hypothetical protein
MPTMGCWPLTPRQTETLFGAFSCRAGVTQLSMDSRLAQQTHRAVRVVPGCPLERQAIREQT